MEHRHCRWDHQDYTIVAGNISVNTVGYTQIGQVIQLDPVVLVRAVGVELHTTTSFAGPPDTYTVKLCFGTTCVEYLFTAATAYELTITDLANEYDRFFPNFVPVNVGCSVKVSNVAVPVDVNGVYLRWLLYEKDTFGDYEKSTSRLLIEKSIMDKHYVMVKDKEAEEFEYLSGLGMS